jgi:transcriptional regulator with XRE-family HTH domain
MMTAELDSPVMQAFDPSRMKAMRKAAGLTQVQAAHRAGMTQGRWSEIESGTREEITVTTMAIIARALNCNAQDLLTPPEE